MRITITIDTNNAAFQPDPWPEVARILHELAGEAEEGAGYLDPPRDHNGNRVGECKVTLE